MSPQHFVLSHGAGTAEGLRGREGTLGSTRSPRQARGVPGGCARHGRSPGLSWQQRDTAAAGAGGEGGA